MRSPSLAPPNSLGESEPKNPSRGPLVEVIFELRWKPLEISQENPASDPKFGCLLGRFFDRIRDEYPALVNLPTTRLRPEQTPHVVRHQFRTKEDAWPLLQIGPGILTANDTGVCRWDAFRPRLSRAVTSLFDAYPDSLGALRPGQAVLRYVNAIPLDTRSTPLVRFVREHLHTSLSLDPALFSDPWQAESPAGLHFSMSYLLETPPALGTVTLATGQRSGTPCLIWQLETRSNGAQAPVAPMDFDPWLEDSHALLVRWFRTLSRGELSETFQPEGT